MLFTNPYLHRGGACVFSEPLRVCWKTFFLMWMMKDLLFKKKQVYYFFYWDKIHISLRTWSEQCRNIWCIHSAVQPTFLSKTLSSLQKETLFPFSSCSPLGVAHSSQPLAAISLLSVSMDILIPDTSYELTHSWWSMYQPFVLFYSLIIFHCMDIPRLCLSTRVAFYCINSGLNISVFILGWTHSEYIISLCLSPSQKLNSHANTF